jgi:hypothetical protein
MATYVVEKGLVCIPKHILPHTLWLKIQKELTVKTPHRYPLSSRNGQIVQYTEKTFLYEVDNVLNVIYIPRVYALTLSGIKIDFSSLVNVCKERQKESVSLSITSLLRDAQKEALEQVLQCIKHVYGACLCAPCGFGKTIIALSIICHLGVRALIIVNTDTMVRQWRARILEHMLDTQAEYIEICTIQSFLYSTCPIKIQQKPGIIVVDEAHFLPARIFSAVLVRSAAYLSSCYRLALTATPERQDNFHVWLFHHFGPIAFQGTIPRMDGEVYMIQRQKRYADVVSYTQFMSMLASDTNRNMLILEHIRKCIKENRCILVLSLYTAHLVALISQWSDPTPHNVYTLFGQHRTVPSNGCIARPCVLFATYALAKQGLDCPVLDTLIVGLPCKNIVQSAGRIMRRTSENTLCIIDVCETHPFVQAGQRARTEYYQHSLKWIVRTIVEPVL